MTTDLAQRLDDDGDDYTFPKWEVGRTISGTLVRYDRFWSDYSEEDDHKKDVCLLRDEQTGHVIDLSNTVLRSKFLRLFPQPGERVAVRCLGMKRSRNSGRDYWNFAVAVDRPERMPEFMQRERAQLEAGAPPERRRDLEITGGSDIPSDPSDFEYGEQRPPGSVLIPDAEVVEGSAAEESSKPDGSAEDDDPIPY